MFFRVQNLGPLRDAEVDLSKDLIVLAGPNNSGKTYLAWSVYGLHRSPSAEDVDLGPWIRQLIESPDHSIELGQFFAQEGANVLDSVARAYESKLHLCFATVRGSFVGSTISLRRDGDVREDKPDFVTLRGTKSGWGLWYTDDSGVTDVWVVRITKKRDADVAIIDWSDLNSDERTKLEVRLGNSLRSFAVFRLLPECILFPAERIAVNIFAKELALKRTEMVDEMVDAELDEEVDAPQEIVRRKAGRYPWPIRDSLKTANDLENLSREESEFAHLAEELENAVLGGRITVSDAGEMLFSPRGKSDSHLHMHLTASVVKSLSSLVFYFRYLAERGDFLIIDEPELNLHPDNQRKITRILAKAVRLGFKIMISTHSDYVLRELNHLIMLSKLPEDERKSLGYDPMSAIAPERMGVYLFDEQTAQPVPIEETGFSIKTIDDVVNQLNADEQRLYARLSG